MKCQHHSQGFRYSDIVYMKLIPVKSFATLLFRSADTSKVFERRKEIRIYRLGIAHVEGPFIVQEGGDLNLLNTCL